MADPERHRRLGLRQLFPPHQEEQLPIGIGEDGECHAEPSALGPGVDPLVDRVPVHPGNARHLMRRPRLLEVLAQDIQRMPYSHGSALPQSCATTRGDADRAAMKTSETRSSAAGGPARRARLTSDVLALRSHP
jgi:hypothetical protein